MIVLASVGAICQAQLSRDPNDKPQRVETRSSSNVTTQATRHMTVSNAA